MGRDKALLSYHGSTFLEHVLSTLREAGLDRVAVVLGHHAEEIQAAVKLSGARVVINSDYRRGQTSSLQAGLETIRQDDVEAVVLCLVDHPAVSAKVISQVIATYRESGAPVVVPTYQGQRGHPVLIARPLFAELLALGPDEGANSVVRKYHGTTHFVEVDDRGILLDVDDPQAYFELGRESHSGA